LSGLRIEKLNRSHQVDHFNCGSEPLNRFLARFALQSQQSNASQTYVGLSDDRVIGFYTLVVGEVGYALVPERLVKGLAQFPVPIMVIARLAVSEDWQGKKVGAGLLKDAVLRTLQAADIAGIRALVVHAKDETARTYYQHFGFADGFSDPLHLYILVKELKKLISAV
jgi:GNAT superfamily N-acetyltransferase